MAVNFAYDLAGLLRTCLLISRNTLFIQWLVLTEHAGRAADDADPDEGV
jgi:hypothetical protein